MEPRQKEILRAENLTKEFRKRGRETRVAVDHVSFSLLQGEVLGLVGESGSGKTTVARLLTRLEDATEGRIYLDGKDITDIKGQQLPGLYRKMQMIFQSPWDSFDPRKTLGYGVGEVYRNQGMNKNARRENVRKMFLACDLAPDCAERYPHEVSGGECQRAAIARALAADPEILICDEATGNLDVTVQKEVLDLLRKLKAERHLSYLFICHDLALVQEFCDRVIVMCGGKIVESGPIDQVIADPQEEYTKNLIASVL